MEVGRWCSEWIYWRTIFRQRKIKQTVLSALGHEDDEGRMSKWQSETGSNHYKFTNFPTSEPRTQIKRSLHSVRKQRSVKRKETN